MKTVIKKTIGISMVVFPFFVIASLALGWVFTLKAFGVAFLSAGLVCWGFYLLDN